MTSSSNLAKYVTEDDILTPYEKETYIRWSKGGEERGIPEDSSEDLARVYTEEAGIARRLLHNPVFIVKELRITTDESFGKRIEPQEHSTENITGVEGYVPIGSVKLKKNARSSGGHADVVAFNRKKDT